MTLPAICAVLSFVAAALSFLRFYLRGHPTDGEAFAWAAAGAYAAMWAMEVQP